jgi:hypothetical protein
MALSLWSIKSILVSAGVEEELAHISRNSHFNPHSALYQEVGNFYTAFLISPKQLNAYFYKIHLKAFETSEND